MNTLIQIIAIIGYAHARLHNIPDFISIVLQMCVCIVCVCGVCVCVCTCVCVVWCVCVCVCVCVCGGGVGGGVFTVYPEILAIIKFGDLHKVRLYFNISGN